nr:CNT_HP1_G0014940.mRNA.1.CDS.1 [Saccharomyces cerevisiae]
MLGTWPLLEEETMRIEFERAEQGSQVFRRCLEGRSKSCIIKYGANLRESKPGCCSTFEL